MRPMRSQKFWQLSNRRSGRPARRGTILVLAALLMVIMMALLALSVDTGYMYTMQTQLDRSVDAAALAGASALVEGTDSADEKVIEYLVRNPVGKPQSVVTDDELVEMTAQFLAEHASDFEIVWGDWNPDNGQLQPTNQLPSAVKVSMSYPNLPFFFGRALGKDSFEVTSSAIAMYQPRDIMVVLDFSGSMNDDSELKSIGQFGLEALMDGFHTMYEELGSPVYGNMQVDPQYIRVEGVDPVDPATQPKITVEYGYKSVFVKSTLDLSNVVLKYSDGSTQKFSSLSGPSGTFEGTGSKTGKPIYKVWVKSGNNPSGEGPDYGEPFNFSSTTIRATIKTALGLDGVDYPYPSGSWNSFIDYGRSNSTNRTAGFEYKFGYANLINYWLEQQPSSYQTPDLWKASAQPVTAVKDSVDVFMDYIRLVDTNDRVGLVVYDASNGEGELESGLTDNLESLVDITRQRQAGHYHNYTNIGAGMRRARQELQAHGRTGAFKMIVLMTDGCANWNNGRYDESAAVADVISEANAAAALRYPIVAISLGAGADLNLMQSVSDITESRHFNVPGGQAVAAYRDGLIAVFREIADDRPLKLVK